MADETNLASEEPSSLGEELDSYKRKCSLQNDELLVMKKEVLKHREKISILEQENESLTRISDRTNQENDQLLEKFDSVSRAARILQDNESTLKEEIKLLREENKSLKQSVYDCNEARDNVIEKLKEVSIETRELIDNCERSTEESKIFRIQCDDLEEELSKLRKANENAENECRRLKSELQKRDAEINSLKEKVSTHSSELIEEDILRSFNNDIPSANDSLRIVEIQLKKLIDRLNESEMFKKQLRDEVDALKRSNVTLQEQNVMKDDIISKQNQDFAKVKNTVDEYHSEILRLDTELKYCHERVSALNQNLETINSENIDLAEYALFKRSLQKFDSLENIENLLAKLQVLQEIEQFFENKLAPHVDPSARDPNDSDPIVACCKENTINKIKSYLEKALVTIEKLNDKMLRLRNEYEVKLRAKNAEISTLRDLMLSATMYNRILERSLQQFRDNVQLDSTIENKTNELLSVNATLIDSFEELKQVYQTNDRCNCFLFAKTKQLKLLCKILQLSINKKLSLGIHLAVDFDGLFFCINEIFEEIDANEFRYKLSQGSESLMNVCERKVTTNHYLKNMVENMSLEVKRLTTKVELEMTEKIQEIEMLKGEVDAVKTDNCDLVNKIKNCNREIVSLSTDNYDLNEKLENLYKVERECESLKQELASLRENSEKLQNFSKVEEECESLKQELASLREKSEKLQNFSKVEEECESLKKELASLREKSEKLQHFSKVEEECESLKQELTILREKTEKLQNFSKVEAECKSLKQELANSREKSQNFSKVEEECESLKQELASLREKSEKLQNFSKVEEECESLKQELAILREKTEKLQNFSKVEAECESLKQELANSREKSQNFSKVEEECEFLKPELASLRDKTANSDATIRNSSLASSIGTLHDLCQHLRKENNSLKNSVDEFVSNFNEILVEAFTSAAKPTLKSADFDKLMNNVNSLRSEQQALKNLANDMKEKLHEDILLLKNEDLKVSRTVQEQLIKLHAFCRELRDQHQSIKSDFKNSLTESISLAKSDFQGKVALVNANFEALVADLEKVTDARNDSKENILSYASLLKSNLEKVKAMNTSLRDLVREMPTEFSKCFLPLIDEMKTSVSSTVENLKTSFACSNEEIIKEMQEMNSELKKRSSTISTLNQTLNDLEKEKQQVLEKLREKENIVSELIEFKKKSQESEQEIQASRQRLEQKYNEEIDAKTKFIENLSTEVENLKNQISGKDDVIASLEHEISKQREGDASSMGTISRTEEVSRLNDVEDSFEERYLKLRCLAVKMKKNIAELNQELKTEKTERAVLQSKLQSVSEQAKRAQSLQEECDKLTDELEIHQNQIRELKRIILESDKENESLKVQCSELTNNTVSSKAEITSSKTEKTEMEVKLRNLMEELEKKNNEKSCEEKVKKERDREISSLKDKLKQTEDSKKKLQNELELAKLEARKQGALTLEMQDYEKTISDLTNKIKTKEDLIIQITEKLNDSLQQNDALQDQIKELEDQIQAYLSNIQTADEEILNLNKSILNHENEAEKLEQRLKQTIHQLENERTKNESLTLQLATSSAELKTLTESSRSKEKQLSDQVKLLQERISQSEEKLKIRESEFTKLKDDFDAYKIRAHNALQKCKAENNSKNAQEKLQTEINSLSSTLKGLRKQLDETLNEMDNQKTEINILKTTKENLTVKVKELSEAVAEKSKEIDSLLVDRKTYKLNTDTLINCYKIEIEKLKSLNEELQRTNAQMQNAEHAKENENANYVARAEDFREGDFPADNGSLHNSSCDLPESEIEAIEETERYRKNSKHSPIPLDKLLQESRTYDWNESELRKHVESLEQQVKYLTSILNESEKNSARSEQQVTFLKEEIRRLERMFEREPHLQNTEYVKNVLFKFITLPCGDERHRLITVLETILKLTAEERHMLSAVAKGDRIDTKQAGGWTSFLGWS